jgi:lysophospholipase L1-like esterase
MKAFGIAGATAAVALLVSARPARAGDEIVYVALGDSTGVGVGAHAGGGYPQRLAARLQRAGQPVRLVNLSETGATSEDLLRRQLERVEEARPTLVTVAIGANDIGYGRSEDEFERDLDEVGARLSALHVPVVVATIPDVSLAPAAAGAPHALIERVARFNARIKQVAAHYRFRLVDLFAKSRELLAAGARALFSDDGFHPSDEGYERWADAMLPTLEKALRSRASAGR